MTELLALCMVAERYCQKKISCQNFKGALGHFHASASETSLRQLAIILKEWVEQ